jgi:hypothetical protein
MFWTFSFDYHISHVASNFNSVLNMRTITKLAEPITAAAVPFCPPF